MVTDSVSFQTSSKPSARIHGGTDQLGVPLHDFSTNSHAMGPCLVAQDAVRQADASHYPDAAYVELRQQLADFHEVDTVRIVLAASASEFIFRITAVAAMQGAGEGGGKVWLPPHSYGDYAQAASAHQLARVDDAGHAVLRWACEPSSPLGHAQAGLAGLVGKAAAPEAFTVLDRAYEPLRLSGKSSLTSIQLHNVWQLWTPNKALGLTGVRAAYVIAPAGADSEVALLEQLCPSWPVGAHGVALLQAWTSAEIQSWLADSLHTLRDWKARQIAMLDSLGWVCLPSDANFFCAQTALPHSVDWQQALSQLRGQGIKLRDTTSFGLPGHVRVSVQPPASQDALHKAWRQMPGPMTTNRIPA